MLSGFLKKLGGGSTKDSTTTKSSASNAEAKPLIIKPGQGIGVRTIGSSPSKVLPKSLDKTTIPTIGNKPKSMEPNFDYEFKNDKEGNNSDNSHKKAESPKVEVSSKVNSILEKAIVVAASTAVEEEIATTFSEGEDQLAIQAIKNHFKDKHGTVDQRIWFMLMDLYQILNDTNEFEKVALSFAQVFGTSPPSWFGNASTNDKKASLGGGQNMIILEPIMDASYSEKFRELFKAAKKENFCRINVSQCKFEQNEPQILEKFLKLMIDLKRSKTVSVLMGDNNLINFCKKFIEDNNFRKNINPALNENEQVIWLLYLELLQWKGQSEEFENIALNFAEKFEVSPPGWDDNGVMDSRGKSSTELVSDAEESLPLDKNLNLNNVNTLLDYIKAKFDKEDYAEVDLSNVERIDFSAAGAISFHIQELWNIPEYAHKKVILRNPNELIIVLLHMVGATEFVHIIPRQRK
jgi:ABC-type transporter Mla MlaB component